MNWLPIEFHSESLTSVAGAMQARLDRDREAEIRIACTDAELEDIYRFRYRIHADEVRTANQYASHDLRMILDPLDAHAVNFAAWDRGRVVGVIRVNLSRRGKLGLYESFYDMRTLGTEHPLRTSIATRFIVDPALRGGSLPMRLIVAIYDYCLRHGVRWNVIDCKEFLVPLFGALGYRSHLESRDHPESGPVNILCLDMHDETHLKALRSPYVPRLALYLATTRLAYGRELA